MQCAHQQRLDLFILGQGANILISDAGFDGLVIRPQLKEITFKETDDALFVTADSGVIMNDLIEWCLDHQILGLKNLAAFPEQLEVGLY